MLYIIRHGETELNSKHVLQGRSNFGLNSKGFDQGRQAAEWFRREGIIFSLEYLDKDSNGKYWSTNIGNCEIYRVDRTDSSWGKPESVCK